MKGLVLRFASLALFAASLMWAGCSPYEPYGVSLPSSPKIRVNGWITDLSDGTPITRVSVKLYGVKETDSGYSTTTLRSAYTDGDGYYYITGPMPSETSYGDLYVGAEAFGYRAGQPYPGSPYDVQYSEALQTVSIQLEKVG